MEENADHQNQYLTLRLDDEVFGITVDRAREVLDMAPITKVPRTPPFMRGMINVRGSVVPVIDLRLKFGMPVVEATVDTRIVILEVKIEGERIVVGAIADAVHEVTELEASEIEPVPKIGTRWDTRFITGIGKRDDQFIIVLAVDRVFSEDEIELFREVADASDDNAA